MSPPRPTSPTTSTRSSTATRSYPTWRPERGGFYWHDGPMRAETEPRARGSYLLVALKWLVVLAAWAAVVLGLIFTIPTLLGKTPHRLYSALQLVVPWLGLFSGLCLLVAVVYRRPVLAVASGFCVLANLLPVWGAVESCARRADERRRDLDLCVEHAPREPDAGSADPTGDGIGRRCTRLGGVRAGLPEPIPGRRDRCLVSEPRASSGWRRGHRHLSATTVAPQ